MTLFISLLFGLQLFYWVVGRLASKKISGNADYFLARKSVTLFPLTMTFVATIVGGGVVLGAAEEAYQFGWPVFFYPLGNVLGLLILGMGFGKRLAEFKVSTVAELFEAVYGSSFLRKAASVLSIVSLFMILVGQLIASQKFLASMGITNIPIFIAFWAIVILYTAQGGLRAVIATDLVQACFFSAIFLACLGYVLYFAPVDLPALNFEEISPVSGKLWGWIFMPMLFMLIGQDVGQRCFAGASSSVVSKASIISGLIVLIVCSVPLYLGCLAKAAGIEVPEGSSVLMTAIQAFTPSWFASFVGCAIIAAIISTVTSFINAIGSNLSEDFNSYSVSASQKIAVLISCLALVFAFYFDNIVDVLIQSYELSVSCLFVSVIIALFKPKGNALAATLSMMFGAAGFILFRIYPIEVPKEILSILLSLAGFGLGELLARRRVYES